MMQRARSHMTSTCSYILRTAALGLPRRLQSVMVRHYLTMPLYHEVVLEC